MKKVLASLFCLALLAAPNLAGENKQSCCSGQKQVTQTKQKASCCASKQTAKKPEMKSCCASKKKQVAKKECGEKCDKTATWMMKPAECKTCQTASL